HFRLYATDQIFWCIFIEYGDEIDCLERSKHLGACWHWLKRTDNAFYSRDRGVAIQANNETIASLTRTSQKLDDARMKHIDATVGKADMQTLFTPLGEMLVKDSPIKNNFLFRC